MSRTKGNRTMADDARRYRWLRDQALAHTWPLPLAAVFVCDNECKVRGQPLDGMELDRHIDAAMATEPLAESPTENCSHD